MQFYGESKQKIKSRMFAAVKKLKIWVFDIFLDYLTNLLNSL